jgi:hypothetical protein
MPAFLKRREEAILGAGAAGVGGRVVVFDDEATLKMKRHLNFLIL